MKISIRHTRKILILSLLLLTSFYTYGSHLDYRTNPASVIYASIALILIFVYVLYRGIRFYHKKIKTKKIIKVISKNDVVWNYDFIYNRAKEVFLSVNINLTNNQLKESNHSPKHYKQTTNALFDIYRKGQKQIIEHTELDSIIIFSLSDYNDNSLDSFSVRFAGFQKNYFINVKTEEIIHGSTSIKERFNEVWTFIRNKDTWVVDMIDKNPTTTEIINGKIYTE